MELPGVRDQVSSVLSQRSADGALRRLQSARPGREAESLYEVCVEFEALFVKQMLSAMRETVPRKGLLDGGVGREIFEDMLYDEYAMSMARTAGFGLADTLYRHLTATQAASLAL